MAQTTTTLIMMAATPPADRLAVELAVLTIETWRVALALLPRASTTVYVTVNVCPSTKVEVGAPVMMMLLVMLPSSRSTAVAPGSDHDAPTDTVTNAPPLSVIMGGSVSATTTFLVAIARLPALSPTEYEIRYDPGVRGSGRLSTIRTEDVIIPSLVSSASTPGSE
jgi:hypothetical protein